MADWIPLLLFGVIFGCILLGYPVAFTVGGLSVLTGLWLFDVQFFYLLNLRIYGTMQNFVLLAVPLFIFMGMVLEKSGIAETMLTTMGQLFGRIRGGLAIAVVLVGTLLAASTGIVGATVVTMGLISLPTLLKQGYGERVSTGLISASGTLGQIIPPSVVLVLLGSVMNVSVGDLFLAALIPGLLLVMLYLIYLLVYARVYPSRMPLPEVKESNGRVMKQLGNSFIYPLLLILLVLGSIFAGIASPTEAAGVGAFGAVVLSVLNRRFSWKMLAEVSQRTTQLTAMVFMILIGATAFSLVFRGLEGERILVSWITSSALTPMQFFVPGHGRRICHWLFYRFSLRSFLLWFPL